MTSADVFGILLDVMLLPLQLILIPIDALIALIPGLDVVPGYITAISSFVGDIPSTIVNLSGVSPILWNAVFLMFLTYISLAPSVNLFKLIWRYIRP